MRILMVCLGNICRSPLAEGILRAKVDRRGLDWTVDSAGTGNWHVGQQPDPRSIAVAGKYGIDISGQRARQFRAGDLDDFDLIVVMDSQNHRDVLRLARHAGHHTRVRLMLDYVHPGEKRGVPDPYYDDDDGFEEVYRLLDAACDRLIDELLRAENAS
jgi:protein-tyrosine phosphatase